MWPKMLLKWNIYQKSTLTLCCLTFVVIFAPFQMVVWQDGPVVISTEECGEVCSYRIIESIPARHYQLIRRHIECENIIARFKSIQIGNHWPPPKFPPLSYKDSFTQNGIMPIKDIKYYPSPHNLRHARIEPLVLEQSFLDEFQAQARKGLSFNDGKIESEYILRQALSAYRSEFEGKDGIIMGVRNPWLEVLLLSKNVRYLTITDYQLPTHKINTVHSQLKVRTPEEFADEYLTKKQPFYDFGVGFLSIGQLGLGRFGEVLNPYGDFEAMAQAWCMIKSGGIFVLGVYYDKDPYLIWNAYRVYNTERLQFLTANWEVIDLFKGEPVTNSIVESSLVTIWVLKKF